MSLFNYKQRNNIVLIAIVALGCFLLYALQNLSGSILGAIVLYTIFRPFYLFLVEKKGWKKGLAALTIILISVIVIGIPFISLSLMVIGKIRSINSENFPVQLWLAKLDAFANTHLNQPHLIDDIKEKLGSYAAVLFPSILGISANIFLTLLILCFLLYYMFTQMREFESTLIKYAPFKQQHALKFATELQNATNSNVIGQGIISLSQGILFTIGLTIVGIPDPIFWGVIGTFMSFLPVIGVPFLSIIFSVVLLITGKTWQGIFLAVYGFGFVVYMDNFLRFFINKKLADTHPLITVIGVVIGIPLFGILGLVFGPVLISFFLLLVEIYETNQMAAERLERISANGDTDK